MSPESSSAVDASAGRSVMGTYHGSSHLNTSAPVLVPATIGVDNGITFDLLPNLQQLIGVRALLRSRRQTSSDRSWFCQSGASNKDGQQCRGRQLPVEGCPQQFGGQRRLHHPQYHSLVESVL